MYDDNDVLAAAPLFAELRELVENAVARPSAIASPNYQEVTQTIYRAINSVLAGEQSAQEALEVLAADLEAITGLPRAQP